MTEYISCMNTLPSLTSDNYYLTLLKTNEDVLTKSLKSKEMIKIIDLKILNEPLDSNNVIFEGITIPKGLIINDQESNITVFSPYVYVVMIDQKPNEILEPLLFIPDKSVMQSSYALLIINSTSINIILISKESENKINRHVSILNITTAYLDAKWIGPYSILLLNDSGNIEYLKLNYIDIGFYVS